MSQIGTLITASGVITTINLNYVPQYITYIAATQLLGIRVTVEGDGTIMDLDAAGLDAMSGIRRFGAVADSFLLPLSDGFIPNKVTQLQFTNSAAQTPKIFAFSLIKGTMYMKTRQQLVLANSSIDVLDFAYLGIKSPVTADIYTVEFEDGQVQRFQFEEFLAWVTLYSNEIDSYVVDNVEGNIRVVNVNPSTDRTVYILDFKEIDLVI